MKGHIPCRKYFSLANTISCLKDLCKLLAHLCADFYCPVCHCPDLCRNCWNKYCQQEAKNNKTVWYTQPHLLHDQFRKLDMVGSLTIWSTGDFFKVVSIYIAYLGTLFHSNYFKEFKQCSMERKEYCNCKCVKFKTVLTFSTMQVEAVLHLYL